MRNASKNTIKLVMRNAKRSLGKGLLHDGENCHNPHYNYYKYGMNSYFLFNEVGAQIWRMTRGKVCNRDPKSINSF